MPPHWPPVLEQLNSLATRREGPLQASFVLCIVSRLDCNVNSAPDARDVSAHKLPLLSTLEALPSVGMLCCVERV